MYASVSKCVTGKRPYMVTSATQPKHNRILSSPVQKHESNPTLNGNEACCLAIVVPLPNVDSHIYMLLLFILVPRQGKVCVPLEHGYREWENKDKVQNNDQNDSDPVKMVAKRTTTPQTSHDRDHDNSNPSNHNHVSCHIHHLRDVVVTMSKYVVETTIPIVGEHEDDINQGKSYRDHDVSNMSD
jgi:hypothetical protein